jgi:tRNA dimethylallyltransferase
MPQHCVIVIGGPTGVGKTRAAINLARHFHTEIVNADSRQVYRELVIGVGRPSDAELAEAVHHLIGHVSIFDPYSAGQFAVDANNALNTILEKNTMAILCGGTGLYLRSVMEGLDVFPEIPHAITTKWTSLYAKRGIAPLVTALSQADPEYVKSVDLQNPMRLIRALAVSEFTGKPYSDFRTGEKNNPAFSFIPIELTLPRDELYRRINQRVIDMIDAGWYTEAESLYPHRRLKALQTVGYQELFDVIDGTRTLNDAIHAIQQETRRYAKRQLTWFRNQGTWRQFHPSDTAGMISLIQPFQT